MSDVVLELGWPLGEAMWFDFDGGEGLLAEDSFLRVWEGVADPDYVKLMESAGIVWWGEINLDDARAWLIGDVPGLLAPSIGRWHGNVSMEESPVLGIWKWLGAPEEFDIPAKMMFDEKQLGKLEWSGKIKTVEGDFRLFSSGDNGQEVLQRNDLPVFRFASGTSEVQVRTVILNTPAGIGRFQLYIIWGTFVGCDWHPKLPS